MSDKTFTFRPQKSIGDVGEKKLSQTYQNITQTDGRISDFIINHPDGTNETIELKTDTYSMNDTPNLFMEYFSNADKGTLGGPWRAAKDKVDYFVYYYLSDDEFFWYKTQPLVEFLSKWIRGKGYKQIKNRGFVSHGFTVPRTEVEHLRVKEPPRK